MDSSQERKFSFGSPFLMFIKGNAPFVMEEHVHCRLINILVRSDFISWGHLGLHTFSYFWRLDSSNNQSGLENLV